MWLWEDSKFPSQSSNHVHGIGGMKTERNLFIHERLPWKLRWHKKGAGVALPPGLMPKIKLKFARNSFIRVPGLIYYYEDRGAI